MTVSTTSLDQLVELAIVHSPHVDHRKLHFKTESGRVTLNGNVETYFEKQMAQEAIRKVDGIESIENQLQVSWN